jgi:hypothetical protein
MFWPFRKDPFDEPWKRIEWDDSFARLITATDDKTLCEGFTDLVGQERVQVSLDEDEPDVCAFLVWRASGPLDGGFGCFLGYDHPPLDPHLLHTRRAFEIVGLMKVVEVFDLAFSAFENSILPGDIEQRLIVWEATDEAFRRRVDQAWYESNRIAPAVAAFIRAREKDLLLRYEFVRKWPENPFKYTLASTVVAAKMKLKPVSPTVIGDQSVFNLRSVYEKEAWFEELEKARKAFGRGFGPRHSGYLKWEKSYLENRKKLVEAVKQRYVGP